MTGNERDSEDNVVHDCFPESVDSILSVFCWESLRVNQQDK